MMQKDVNYPRPKSQASGSEILSLPSLFLINQTDRMVSGHPCLQYMVLSPGVPTGS